MGISRHVDVGAYMHTCVPFSDQCIGPLAVLAEVDALDARNFSNQATESGVLPSNSEGLPRRILPTLKHRSIVVDIKPASSRTYCTALLVRVLVYKVRQDVYD